MIHELIVNQKPDCSTSLVLASSPITTLTVQYNGIYLPDSNNCFTMKFRNSGCGGTSFVA